MVQTKRLDGYLTLAEFCTCTQTYRKYADQIDPYPKNWEETMPALVALCQHILDPVIDEFGQGRFQLTYGFCSADLQRSLAKKQGRLGPLTLETREWMLGEILRIQEEVNTAADQCGQPTVNLINDEELARIRGLIAAQTWPEKWDGTEHRGDEWLPDILPDGSIQPILFSNR
jgi:hypothetical protein